MQPTCAEAPGRADAVRAGAPRGAPAAQAQLFDADPWDAAVDALHEATAIYTCEPVVGSLLDRLRWPACGGTLADSSCGDGAFLGVALQRLLARAPAPCDDELLARVAGWEIHPGAAGQARERLRRVLLSHGSAPDRAQRLARAMVRCADFLIDGPGAGMRFDTIVGNPPYLRMPRVPEPLRSAYRGAVPRHAGADLLHGFLDRCAGLLAAGGELAFVSADRWLFASGAAGLRAALGQRFSIVHVARLNVRSAYYRPKVRRAGTLPRVHPVAVVLGSREAGLALGPEPIYPVHEGGAHRSAAAGAALAAGTPTLGDIADVRLGPYLGTAGVFLVDRDAAAGLPADHLVPAVDTDDVRAGVLQAPTRWAIATRPDRMPPAAVLDHLQREMPRMCARGRRSRTPWLPPEPFHRLDLARPLLMVSRIARSPEPVRVPAGVLTIGHNLSIVARAGTTLDAIEALLRSPSARRWVRDHAAPLENGYHALTARLLRRLPVTTV